MKPDAIIEEAVSGLKNPKAYVDGVLVHMKSCLLAYGSAYLRLGASTKGTGQYPCYRIVYQKDGSEKIFGSFVDSHKPFPEPYDKIAPGEWSTVASGIHEVIAVSYSLAGQR